MVNAFLLNVRCLVACLKTQHYVLVIAALCVGHRSTMCFLPFPASKDKQTLKKGFPPIIFVFSLCAFHYSVYLCNRFSKITSMTTNSQYPNAFQVPGLRT